MPHKQTNSTSQTSSDQAKAEARTHLKHDDRQLGNSRPPPSDDSEARPKLDDNEDSKVPGVADKPTHSGYEEKQGDAHGNTKRGS